MLGGRALLAFQRNETVSGKPLAVAVAEALGEADLEPSEDALLGAIMAAEHQSASIQLLELVGKWAEGWSKSKRGRRQQ